MNLTTPYKLSLLTILLLTGKLFGQDKAILINDKTIHGKIEILADSSLSITIRENEDKLKIEKFQIFSVEIKDKTTTYFCDEIRLLDGNFNRGNIVQLTETEIIYEVESKNRVKTRSVDLQLVYSIIDKNGSETILYRQDQSKEGELNEEAMGSFWRGQQSAIKHYTTMGTSVGGLVLGSASIVFSPVSALYPAVGIPLLYTYGHYLPFSKVNISKATIPDQYSSNENFLLGYKVAGRKKRIGNALKSSVGGAIIGILTYSVASSLIK